MSQHASGRSGRGRRQWAVLAAAAAGVGAGLGARGARAAVLTYDPGSTAGPGWNTTLGNWFNASIGTTGGDQVWGNGAADTAVFDATGAGSPNVTVGAVNAGTIQFNASGYTLAGGAINLSTGSTAGLVTVAAGDAAAINSTVVNGNTSGLNVNGVGTTTSTYTTGTLTLGGTFAQVNINLPAGGLNIVGASGNTFALGNAFNLGGSAANLVATSNISGPETFAIPYLEVATNGNNSVPTSGSATLNVSGGAVIAVSSELFIARSVTSTGMMTVTDSTVTVPATATKVTYIGQNGTAVLNVNGTSTFTDSATGLFDVGSGAASNGTITLGDSATITVSSNVVVGDSGVGTINVGAGTFNASGGVLLAKTGATGAGTVNLNGGTLYALSVAKGASTSANGAVFNFSGGTLATLPASPTAFMTGLTAAYVNAGGAVIDTTNAGVTIAQPLLAPVGGGTSGGLTKVGTGALTLTGSSTYTGETNIAAGSLVLGAGGSIAASGRINAGTTGTAATLDVSANGLTLAPGQALGGTGAVLGSVTVGPSGVITAGTDATTGKLTESGGTQTWATGGAFVAKVTPAGDGAAVASNDLLSLSSLSITAGTGGFNVSVPSTTGSPATYTVPIVLADVTGGTNPFNASTLASLSLSTPGLLAPSPGASLQLGTLPDGAGGFELLVVAAPEPTSLALVGLAAAPLIVGRQRRRRSAAARGAGAPVRGVAVRPTVL